MPFVGHWAERFGKDRKLFHPDRRFAGLGGEGFAFDSDEIAEIEQVEDFKSLGSDFLGIYKDLDASGGIGEIAVM